MVEVSPKKPSKPKIDPEIKLHANNHVREALLKLEQEVDEATASLNVLGLGYEALGMGVAKAWGLPQGMRHCMKKPTGEPPVRPPGDALERMRWTAQAANDIADTLLTSDPKDVDSRLAELAQRYSRTLGVSPADVKSATVKARQKLVDRPDHRPHPRP